MNLLTAEQMARLLTNGDVTASGREHDPHPVVKLFTPDANATWLLSELDPRDHDLAYGLCDLGLGSPELGYVRLSELAKLRGPSGCAVERDHGFVPRITLSEYATVAHEIGRIWT